MRSFLLIASAILAFAATMTVETTDANAVVCARGVYRAGCAGYRGAVVVRRPVAVRCRMVMVNGVMVRRCY
jgi:nitrous oxidase accessory protein NosD